MKLFAASMLMLSAAASPFDSCGNAWSKRIPAPTPTEPAKPPCLTDPPFGCQAHCIGGNDSNQNEDSWVTFTDNCKDISAGPQTAAFEAAVGMGGYMCNPCIVPVDPDSPCDPPLDPILPADIGIATTTLEASDACASP